MSANLKINSEKLIAPYMWITAVAGGLIYFMAAHRIDRRIVDVKFAVLVVITVFLSSRISIFGRHASAGDAKGAADSIVAA